MSSPWRSILLHVDAAPASVARLQVALDVAERHDARVTALFAGIDPEPDAAFAYSAAAAFDELASARRLEWREAARTRLRRAAGDDRSHVAWFDLAGDALVPAFVAEAAYADLLVLGTPGGGASGAGGAPAGFVESVLLESGRPALVVPPDAPGRAPGRRVLVAWNGSPPAARALAGALPLLEQAEEVHVASWSRAPACAPCSGISIGEMLGRHGIAAEMHRRAPTSRVGEELAALARRLDADLVVMGCYGHSRTREWMLGGVTRTMLNGLAVPMLLAH